MIHLSYWDQHLPTMGRILVQRRWFNCIGLLTENMIVPVIFSQIFNLIVNLVLQIYQTEVSIWQAVTWNLGVGLWDIFRISDFSES